MNYHFWFVFDCIMKLHFPSWQVIATISFSDESQIRAEKPFIYHEIDVIRWHSALVTYAGKRLQLAGAVVLHVFGGWNSP